MSYVGNKPALNYVNLAVQHFTTSATATYTLNQSVSDEVDIALFINNVRQQPGSSYAYTASGTTLTLSQATAGTDTMYCIFLGKAVETVNPPAGSVNTSELVDNAVTTAKITSDAVTYDKIQDIGTANRVLGGATTGTVGEVQVVDAMTNFVSTSSAAGLQIKGDGSSDGYLQLNCSQNSHGIKLKSPAHSAGASYTLTFPTTDGNSAQFLQTDGSGVLTWADAGGTNTPAFEAYTGTTVGVTNNAWTKATFGTERYDTASAFATSRFTVPSGQAGKYHFYTAVRAGNDGANTLDLFQPAFYKNGSLFAANGTATIIFNSSTATINNFGAQFSQTLDLAVNDYVEVYVFVRTSVGSPDLINDSLFGGFKLIE